MHRKHFALLLVIALIVVGAYGLASSAASAASLPVGPTLAIEHDAATTSSFNAATVPRLLALSGSVDQSDLNPQVRHVYADQAWGGESRASLPTTGFKMVVLTRDGPSIAVSQASSGYPQFSLVVTDAAIVGESRAGQVAFAGFTDKTAQVTSGDTSLTTNQADRLVGCGDDDLTSWALARAGQSHFSEITHFGATLVGTATDVSKALFGSTRMDSRQAVLDESFGQSRAFAETKKAENDWLMSAHPVLSTNLSERARLESSVLMTTVPYSTLEQRSLEVMPALAGIIRHTTAPARNGFAFESAQALLAPTVLHAPSLVRHLGHRSVVSFTTQPLA